MTAERPTSGLTLDLGPLKWGGLLFLVLLAYAVRLPGLTAQSLWRDEVDALHFSQGSLNKVLGNLTRPGWNGPLYYLVLRGWVALTGQTEFALRYFSLLFGVLGVALLYRIGRAWFSRPLGVVAALLMALSPYMVWYAQETKMYAMLAPWVMGVLYLYRRALRYRNWRLWALVVAGVWALIGLHVIGVLLIPVLVALLPFWWPLVRDEKAPSPASEASRVPATHTGSTSVSATSKSFRQKLVAAISNAGTRGALQAAVGLGLCLLPVIVVLPWAWRMLWRGRSIGHPFVPLPNMVSTMLYAFGRGITTAGGLWPIGLAILFVLAGVLLWPDAGRLIERARIALAGRRRKVGEVAYVGVLCAWFAVPLLGLLVISLRVPMFVDRYLIWTGPAFFLLVARGYDQLRRRMAWLATLCLAALLILNGAAILAQSTTPIKSDFRGAAAFLREQRRPGEPILFHLSYVRDTFEYYFGPVMPAAEGIPTDEQTTPESVDRAMRAQLENAQGEPYKVVWLVLSEPEMWDQRGMTVAWLDAQARPDLRVEFARVSVVRYRFD
jgi:hypothetical protein